MLLLTNINVPAWLVIQHNIAFILNVILFIAAISKDPGYIKQDKTIDFYHAVEAVSEEIQHRLTLKLSVYATRRQAEPICLRRLLCPICEVVRSERSRHCPICNRCVNRFDHHCPWINNCVGNSNHCIFVGYLASSLLNLATVVLLMAVVIKGLWTSDANLLEGADSRRSVIGYLLEPSDGQ